MKDGGASVRSYLRLALVLLAIGSTIAGLVNVYGDNSEVTGQAELVACGKPRCAVQTTRVARTPFSQGFTFQTSVTPQKTEDVECKRAFVLVGEYQCELQKSPR